MSERQQVLQSGPRAGVRYRLVVINPNDSASSGIADFNWSCPVCGLELQNDGKIWLCNNGHSFDIARQGYVNLLLAQHKKSRNPGDDAETVSARRRFLQSGHYLPLAEKIAGLLASFLPVLTPDEKYRLLDCGCGEAWYIESLQKLLPMNKLESVDFAGLDISRPAIQAAAKSVKNVHFSIASAFFIPLPTQSTDCVLQVFAPSSDKEIHRVLKPDGIFIRVTPGKKHLLQLREKLYDKVIQREINQPGENYFEIIREETTEFDLNLQSTDEIKNLLRMTSHFWKANTAQRKCVLGENSLKISTDFVVSVYRKIASGQINPWEKRNTSAT